MFIAICYFLIFFVSLKQLKTKFTSRILPILVPSIRFNKETVFLELKLLSLLYGCMSLCLFFVYLVDMLLSVWKIKGLLWWVHCMRWCSILSWIFFWIWNDFCPFVCSSIFKTLWKISCHSFCSFTGITILLCLSTDDLPLASYNCSMCLLFECNF